MTEQARHTLQSVGFDMISAGLPVPFVQRVLVLALQEEGADDLVLMWGESEDSAVRYAIEADLFEMLEDDEHDAESLFHEPESIEDRRAARVALKAHLRELVETVGGVAEVAARADLPQAALTRTLDGLAIPSVATFQRLAHALSLPVHRLIPSRGAARIETPIAQGARA